MHTKVVAGALVAVLLTGGGLLIAKNQKPVPAVATSEVRRPKVEIVNAEWSDATGQRYYKLATAGQADAVPALPELRVYDATGRLLLKETGASPGNTGEKLDTAIRSARSAKGPSFTETLAELKIRDRHSPSELLRSSGKVTIFDYWADWCAPCKVIEKELLTWADRQPLGSVRIVKVEADIVKVMKAQGVPVTFEKKAAERAQAS